MGVMQSPVQRMVAIALFAIGLGLVGGGVAFSIVGGSLGFPLMFLIGLIIAIFGLVASVVGATILFVVREQTRKHQPHETE
jgi:MFS family permease